MLSKHISLTSWILLRHATSTMTAERTQKVRATERVMMRYSLHSDSVKFCSEIRLW